MSYPKLVKQTSAVAAALAELNVRAGDRVLIMLPDGPGFADAFARTIQQRGVPHQGIIRQLQLPKPLLEPWLD